MLEEIDRDDEPSAGFPREDGPFEARHGTLLDADQSTGGQTTFDRQGRFGLDEFLDLAEVMDQLNMLGDR